MTGYLDDPDRERGGHARRLLPHRRRGEPDDDGYITYVGRTDDVFKASDYRISPFELESVLIEHAAVAEAAVVPSPDPLRLAVPKAYVRAGRRPRSPAGAGAGHPAPTARSGWRRTSGSAGWSSPICPRRSPARSAGWNCAAWRRRGPRRRAGLRSSGRKTSPGDADGTVAGSPGTGGV